MLRLVHETILRRHLFLPGQTVLVAVSGGADSVALLYALHYFHRRLGTSLSVAHLNHGIRGREADRDEDFVRHLAWRLGLPFAGERENVPALARRRGLSIEMAAREARYEFFVRAAAEAGADLVATAHTADDQAETVLLRILRGTGPQGLGGMDYRSTRGRIALVRPMLDVTHADAVAFLERHGRTWREDASNRDTKIPRNWVRHTLLPLVERGLNPQVRGALLRMARLMRDENEWLAKVTSPGTAERTLEVSHLGKLSLAARRRAVLQWLIGQHVEAEALDFDAIERVLELARTTAGTRSVPLSATASVLRRYGVLMVERSRAAGQKFSAELKVPGETGVPGAGLHVRVTKGRGFRKSKSLRAGTLPSFCQVSAAAVGRSKLALRTWKPGDRIRPLGMDGSRKVQDILVDAKVPRDERGQLPVLVCRDTVIWIPGYRIARGWEVRDGKAASLRIDVERA
jgi:tRNA(Ile)-lysidine synthase